MEVELKQISIDMEEIITESDYQLGMLNTNNWLILNVLVRWKIESTELSTPPPPHHNLSFGTVDRNNCWLEVYLP